MESVKGRLLYSGAFVTCGLTYKGAEFLAREVTFSGKLRRCGVPTLKWAITVAGGAALVALVGRLFAL